MISSPLFCVLIRRIVADSEREDDSELDLRVSLVL